MSEHIISFTWNIVTKAAVILVQINDDKNQTCTFEKRTWLGNQVVMEPANERTFDDRPTYPPASALC